MKLCPKCGNKEPESAKFCSVCGGGMAGAARQNPFRSQAGQEAGVVLGTAATTGAAADTQTREEPKESKGKKLAVIAVVILILLLAMIAAVAVFGGGDSEEESQTESQATVEVVESVGTEATDDDENGGEASLEITYESNGEEEGQEEADLTEGEGEEEESTQTEEQTQAQEESEEEAEEEEEAVVTVNYTYTDMDNTTMYVLTAVYVRALPCKDGDILGSLKAEAEVTVTGTCNQTGWYRVIYKGDVGYVSYNYLTDEAPVEEEEEAEETTTSDSTTTTTGTSKTYAGTTITTDYILADSSSTYLTESDLSGLTATQLKLARNEIYARHGYTFKNSELQEYFDSCSWYTASVSYADFDDSVFNEYETANLSTIKAYEATLG